jgi:hypothetical protein
VFREIGYFLGIEFDSGVRWSQRDFKPQHLLDPRKLVSKKKAEVDTTPPVATN